MASVAGGSGMPSPDEAAAAAAASAAGSATGKKLKKPLPVDSKVEGVANAALERMPLDVLGRIASFGGVRAAGALGQVLISTPPQRRAAAAGGGGAQAAAAAKAAASAPESTENIYWSETLKGKEDAVAAKLARDFIKNPRGFRFPDAFNEGIRAQVRHLDLKDYDGEITPDILRAFHGFFPNLTSLRLLGADINDEALGIIATQWPNLQSLDLPHNLAAKFTATGLARLGGCPNLVKLNIEYMMDMDDAMLQALRENCPNLRELSLRNSRGFTSAGAEHLGGFRHLEKLNLASAAHWGVITDATLRTLASGCPNLREINLMSHKITPAGIAELQRAFGGKLKIIR